MYAKHLQLSLDRLQDIGSEDDLPWDRDAKIIWLIFCRNTDTSPSLDRSHPAWEDLLKAMDWHELALQPNMMRFLQERLASAIAALLDQLERNGKLFRWTAKGHHRCLWATAVPRAVPLNSEEEHQALEVLKDEKGDYMIDSLALTHALHESFQDELRRATSHVSTILEQFLHSAEGVFVKEQTADQLSNSHNAVAASMEALETVVATNIASIEGKFRSQLQPLAEAITALERGSSALQPRADALTAPSSPVQLLPLLRRSRGSPILGEQYRQDKKVEELEDCIHALSSKLSKSEIERRGYLAEVLRLKGSVRVFCRLKPFAGQAHDANISNELDTLTGRGFLRLRATAADEGRAKLKTYIPDQIFDESCRNETIANEVVDLVRNWVYQDENTTVFVYGQTGSGKSYTMHTGPDSIVPGSLKIIWEMKEDLEAKKGISRIDVQGCFVELYNDKARDLQEQRRTISREAPRAAKIVTSADGLSQIDGCDWVTFGGVAEADVNVQRATRNRLVSATSGNVQSSRSHVLFLFRLKKTCSEGDAVISKMLALVDLAGSESLQAENEVRASETKAIGSSLFQLRNLLRKIGADMQGAGARNTRLNHILSHSLRPGCQILIIETVDPWAPVKQIKATLEFGEEMGGISLRRPNGRQPG